MSSKTVLTARRHEGRPATSDDLELFKHIEAILYTAVLSDALDEIGVQDRVMREHLRPLAPDSVFVGWARTVLCMDVHYIPEDPYALEIEAVDSILPGEVVVVGTGASVRNAPWGELLSTAAMARGARGAVIDGLIRDVKKILQLGFPVFASGIKPVDSRGRGLRFRRCGRRSFSCCSRSCKACNGQGFTRKQQPGRTYEWQIPPRCL